MIADTLKQVVKKIPVVGSLAVKMRKTLRSRSQLGLKKAETIYQFERIVGRENEDKHQLSLRQLQNLLNYTKTSQTAYAAGLYAAGYHTIKLNGKMLGGQRNPATRLDSVPVDWNGKSILDVGCNQGGMLHELANSAKWAVGIDFDSRMINAANKICQLRGSKNLHFYVFNLEEERLDLIEDLLPEPKADIVFLLSVCMWLRNWHEVVSYSASIAESMLFESNGSTQMQLDQENHLKTLFDEVTVLAERSEDDPGHKDRKLFYCTEPRQSGR